MKTILLLALATSPVAMCLNADQGMQLALSPCQNISNQTFGLATVLPFVEAAGLASMEFCLTIDADLPTLGSPVGF